MSALNTGIFAFGTQVHIGDGASPQNFYPIAGLGDVSMDISTDEVETTTHGTGDPHHETIPGLMNYGSVSFPVNYDPAHATHSATSTYGLAYLQRNRLIRAFQHWALKSDGSYSKRQFDGWVMELGEAYPVNGVQTRNVKIRVKTPPSAVS